MTNMTRRAILAAGAALAASAFRRQSPRTLAFEMPQNACDCHVHVFDPARFPFAPGRTYTPEHAALDELRALHRRFHIKRTVIVQASVYGTNNACLLDALGRLGSRARGVAVVAEDAPDAELDRLRAAGVRGIRVNLETTGQTDPALGRRRFEAAQRRAFAHDWHVQVYTRPPVIEAMKDLVSKSPVPVVFDHFGGAQAAAGLEQPGFATLLELVRSGRAYVKISAPYRGVAQSGDFAAMAPFAQALIAANTRRVLWGSDWPHPNSSPSAARSASGTSPRLPVDDAAIVDQLAAWVPDPALRRTILVENPAVLYRW